MGFGSYAIMLGGALAIPAILVLALFALKTAANRFEKRQRQLGCWNTDGPKHPTEPPRNWGRILGAGEASPPRIEQEGGNAYEHDHNHEHKHARKHKT